MLLRHALPAALLLLAAPAAAGPREGQAAWEAGDYGKAVAEWRPAAIAGDASAQYGLGQAYLYGRGVTADLAQAELWYRKAAAQGHLEAGDNLGLLLFQKGQRRDALPYLERSSARGEPRAQYVLGTAKFNGELVDRDWVGAYALMTRASSAGLPQASRALAQMDREIPLAQRQQGQVLARNLEVSGMRVAMAEPMPEAGVPPTVPVTAAGRPATGVPVARVDLPPSTPAPVFGPAPDPNAPVLVATNTPAAAARPPVAVKAPAAAATATGNWLIQIGAFRSRASAQERFAAVRRSVPSLSLEPFLQDAGAVTRVRAGSFASQSAAEAACRSIRATGQACFPVRR